MAISTTVLLWVNKWLIYYELWKATGQWYGGGEYLVFNKRQKARTTQIDHPLKFSLLTAEE